MGTQGTVDRGQGPAILLIPGIQSRWEFMRRTVDTLAARGFRVLSFSLGAPADRGAPLDPARGFAHDVARIDRLLDRAGLPQAAVCGMSAGGEVAVQYAADRPGRVSHLILVSAAGPRWTPDAQMHRYLRRPLLFAPAFLAGTRARLAPEIRAAFPRRRDRVAFAARQLMTLLTAPVSPRQMAERARLMARVDLTDACRRISAPTLVITGEDALDTIVPAAATREYVGLIRNARAATIERTGHVGLVTRPDRFAELVGEFINGSARP